MLECRRVVAPRAVRCGAVRRARRARRRLLVSSLPEGNVHRVRERADIHLHIPAVQGKQNARRSERIGVCHESAAFLNGEVLWENGTATIYNVNAAANRNMRALDSICTSIAVDHLRRSTVASAC